MFTALIGKKEIPCIQYHCFDFAMFLIKHLNDAIHNSKNFLTIIYMPLMGLSVQCKRTEVPLSEAMSIASQAFSALKSLLIIVFIIVPISLIGC